MVEPNVSALAFGDSHNVSLNYNETASLHRKLEASIPLTVFALTFAMLTMCLNAMVALFFSCKMHLCRSLFNQQIYVLSIVDTLVGMSFLLMVPAYMFPDTVTYFCGATICIFVSMQLSSLSIILGICIQRLIVMSNLTKFVSERKKKYFLFHCAGTCIVCPSIVSFLFFKYRVTTETLAVCDTIAYFGNNRDAATTPIQILFVLMQVSTDIIYACLWIRLFLNIRKSVKKQHIRKKGILMPSSDDRAPSSHTISSKLSPVVDQNSSVTKASDVTPLPSGPLKSRSPIERIDFPFPVKILQSMGSANYSERQRETSGQENLGYSDNDNSSVLTSPNQFPSSSIYTLDFKKSTLDPHKKSKVESGRTAGKPHKLRSGFRQKVNRLAALNNSTSGLQMQKRSLTTIGILLVFYNVCLSPYNVLSLADMFSSYELSRKHVSMITASMSVNSFINFFIYAFKTTELRKFLSESWRGICALRGT